MRYETKTIRIGENVGPVDWEHETARDMPPIWREAEKRPQDFVLRQYGWPILALCMYDGWPYWEPRPAIQFIGPIGPEWAFFNSYAIYPDSIIPRKGIEAEWPKPERVRCAAREPRSAATPMRQTLPGNHHD